jgi:hypothetical protein
MLRPDVDEVQPAILYPEVPGFLLGHGLVPEVQLAAIVDLTGNFFFRSS